MDPHELLELDILIAERLMGWTVFRYRPEAHRQDYEAWLARFRRQDPTALHLGNGDTAMSRYSMRLSEPEEDGEHTVEEWSPSRNIADAMEVVRTLRSDGFQGYVCWETGPLYRASFRTENRKVDVEDLAETPELAIARAAAKVAGLPT